MKISIKTLICALALSTSVAFAGPDSDAKKPVSFETGIYKTLDGNLKVNVVKNTPAFTAIVIMNSNGEVLARESLSKRQSKGAVKFDISSLQDGEYTVAVLSKGEKQVKQFTIASEKSVTTRSISFE